MAAASWLADLHAMSSLQTSEGPVRCRFEVPEVPRRREIFLSRHHVMSSCISRSSLHFQVQPHISCYISLNLRISSPSTSRIKSRPMTESTKSLLKLHSRTAQNTFLSQAFAETATPIAPNTIIIRDYSELHVCLRDLVAIRDRGRKTWKMQQTLPAYTLTRTSSH